MKKLLLLLPILSLCLTSCNEQIIGFGSLSFHYVHVQMYNQENPTHFKITSWREDNGGIELKTENYGTILVGDGTYLAYDVEECPICGQVEYK